MKEREKWRVRETDSGRTMFLVISVSTLTSDLRLNLKGNGKIMDGP